MSNSQRTIVTDLDGTPIRTDMLLEFLLALIKQNLLYVFMVPFWLI